MYCSKNLFNIKTIKVFIGLYNSIILCVYFVDKIFNPQKKQVTHKLSTVY